MKKMPPNAFQPGNKFRRGRVIPRLCVCAWSACLVRRGDHAVKFKLPAVTTATDIAVAMNAVSQAAASGNLTLHQLVCPPARFARHPARVLPTSSGCVRS